LIESTHLPPQGIVGLRVDPVDGERDCHDARLSHGGSILRGNQHAADGGDHAQSRGMGIGGQFEEVGTQHRLAAREDQESLAGGR